MRQFLSQFLSKKVGTLALIQFCSWFIVTFNYRAVAEVHYIALFVTDIALALLQFSSIKRVAEASTLHERIAYVLGGSIGALIALYLSTFFFGA